MTGLGFRIVGVAAAVGVLAAGCSTTDDVAGVRDDLEVSIPDLTIPEITISDITIPDISLPDISLPDISLPDITDVSDGVVFDAPAGDYRVVFPGPPDPAELPVPLPGATVVAQAYVYEVADGAYLTSAFDYPDGLTGGDASAVLTGARDGAIESVDGVLGDSETIELDGTPGIRFTFALDNAGDPGVGTAVVYFDAPRLYQAFALGVPAGAATYDEFVDTFEFTGAGS